MRIKRLKNKDSRLKFYCNNFGFRKPFQVLIDGTFCFEALKSKLNIRDQIPKYFDTDVKLLTTPCIINETEKLGPNLYGAMLIAKQFAIHYCGHEKSPTTGSECFLSMVGEKNANRYIVATQDKALQRCLRKIVATPLLYLCHKAPTLESPSDVTKAAAEQIMTSRFAVNDIQKETIKELKIKTFGPEKEKKFKKRKKKQPNPLSCLKSKRKKGENNVQDTIEKPKNKKKRVRVKVPKHVKEELQKMKTDG
uniref:rRNA-processing protein UTP23 homolog n=1 Tax=Cacopsylla melanoneura TaxID=428564 RepID=A0A8D8PYQ1_9HEMI